MSATPIWDATVRAWCADHVERAFADLRAYVGLTNPLAADAALYCGCGTYLGGASSADPSRVHRCPMGCAS